jgi:nucleoid DNA-binding protein
MQFTSKARIEDIMIALAETGRAVVRGVGVFTLGEVKARDYYIPSADEKRHIPAHKIVRFTAHRDLNRKMTAVTKAAAEITAIEQEIARLEAKHGTGVRPEWVGEEIGMLLGRLRHIRSNL